MPGHWPRMAEVINLRRARKAEVRAQDGKDANANRVLHGTPKPLRDLAKARTQKAEQTLKGHRLDPET